MTSNRQSIFVRVLRVFTAYWEMAHMFHRDVWWGLWPKWLAIKYAWRHFCG